MLGLRLMSFSVAGLLCFSIVWLALNQRFSAITDMFDESEAIKVEVEEKEKPPPPPPPPNRPPPPPPPDLPPMPPPPVEAPPIETPLPVQPPNPVITNPNWVARPSGSDLSRYYPSRAIERDREGRVTLNCVVSSDGSINCSVASESPEGWGFGAAALQLSRIFRMSPRMENGQPTEGGRVTVTIPFRLSTGR